MNAAKQHTQCRNFPQDYQWISKQLDTENIFSYVDSATILKFFILFTGVKSMHMADALLSPTVPATGSSGHIGGGLLLAILLGPHAAFLTLSSVLTVQALFFADGGLLALGCNIFNLGFFPCFIAYPFIYKKITGNHLIQQKLITGSILAALIGLQLGAFLPLSCKPIFPALPLSPSPHFYS
jgi:hypothetical protein